ncbi:hypothetical protein BC938DRAFT_480920 [Jimgerdemannia flammicorona]|uniref:Uncharacterized protein n=1 Tax=Jimgerdemannia flammicorona TaxID=994334 RepID=A0A433QHH1_9FUNG|nr:hypothetical protein BC938DRAFT_480920 [Jimgerdemannia flammicorona]
MYNDNSCGYTHQPIIKTTNDQKHVSKRILSDAGCAPWWFQNRRVPGFRAAIVIRFIRNVRQAHLLIPGLSVCIFRLLCRPHVPSERHVQIFLDPGARLVTVTDPEKRLSVAIVG